MLETIDDCLAVFGPERRVVIAKELTKLFETFHVSSLGDAKAWFAEDANRLKGEFVLILEAVAAVADDENAEGERVLSVLLEEGLSVKQASGLAAKITGAQRKVLYERALQFKHETDSA